MFQRLDLIQSPDANPAPGPVAGCLQAAVTLVRAAPVTITAPLVRRADPNGALHGMRVLGRTVVTDLLIGYLAAQAQTVRLWLGPRPEAGWTELRRPAGSLVEIEVSLIGQACAMVGEPLASQLEAASAPAKRARHQRLAQLRAQIQSGACQRPDLAPELAALADSLSSQLQLERSRWI